ncbi:sphingomyelin phosphodiesterase 3 [Alosa sapidissima]|uniref:sphingomyelin phosphodiesterase 3 n=1 Tax=Alosa sapidissima TaxID=34773 RepID=UPI001C081A8A|nr:sphingomyelin phosphodiesterase 3 [Alosa sapidissima]XP_041967065.1 sphingomyelin phosphodiesterase 3 [Alosa sapidissima]XP_041967066.1 sphingomyelin phosphodiesterase 3 [Alosa sapidissima]XP_041967068.1 sphingomyelin phosphodiesterase 3 [Alosa sapidissima]
MGLHASPYPSALLCFLDGLSWGFIFPCYWLLNCLLGSCVPTSLEKRRRSQDPCSFSSLSILVVVPLYLLLLLASLPFALLGFLVWAPLQTARQSYLYTHQPVSDKQRAAEQGAGLVPGEWRPQGRSFCFSSANVCLLPDALARFNNLADTQSRAGEVGRRIRNGASRPQIKIYIDSPTNTSISAASFSSLAMQSNAGGFRRTSSLDQRPESEPAESSAGDCPVHQSPDGPIHRTASPPTIATSAECPAHPPVATPPITTSAECPAHQSVATPPITTSSECPAHPSVATPLITSSAECPAHSSPVIGSASDCPLHSEPLPSSNQDTQDCPLHPCSQSVPDCPLHPSSQSVSDCPLHPSSQSVPDCSVHSSGVQISISAPEANGRQEPPRNHRPDADTGSLDSRTASRESLTRFHGDGGGSGGGVPSNNTLSHRTSVFKRHVGRKRRHGDDGFDHEISAFFPANLDFLCLQEVFEERAAGSLRRQLHRYFPYLLSDVGRYAWRGCCSRFKFLNSGLLLASRYPILDAHFECYPNGRGEDALASKGALFAKVQVGTSSTGQRVVGYIACTHLHAIEGDAAVRCEQLDLLLEWGMVFRKATSCPVGEKGLEDQVAFDVILGDLNFDNCSSEDKLEQQHVLFTHYKDPCRLGAGEDKPWALGTLLDTDGLYDEEVSSPESLQKVMENEEARKEYLVYPKSKNQCHSQKGRKIPLKGNGRRIDYILYREDGLQPEWKVDIEEFSFITQLAGLTDHLSVAIRLAVATGEEEP